MIEVAALLMLPDGAWLWLALSLVLHLVYLAALVKAFETADMGAVYPVMRGSAPVIAAAAAVALIGAPITPLVILGIVLVSLGTMTIAFWQPPSLRAIAWALLTGTMIAAYTVVDAQGVRAAPSAPSYIVWVFLLDGIGIAALFAWWRGPVFKAEARQKWRRGAIARGLSIITYGAGPMGLSDWRCSAPRCTARNIDSVWSYSRCGDPEGTRHPPKSARCISNRSRRYIARLCKSLMVSTEISG